LTRPFGFDKKKYRFMQEQTNLNFFCFFFFAFFKKEAGLISQQAQ